jgi:uncharacterized surface protein with fasciclin (FAS1) repeats
MTFGHNATSKLGVLAAAVGLALGAATAQSQERATDRDSRIQASQSAAELGSGPLAEAAKENPQISSFAAAVHAAGLDRTLSSGDAYTVFAPTNAALADKGGPDFEELMQPENRDELASFLRAHISEDAVDLQSPREINAAKTLDGETVEIEREDDETTAKIGDANVEELEGITVGSLKIYAIDDVLVRKGQDVEDAPVRSGVAVDSDAVR